MLRKVRSKLRNRPRNHLYRRKLPLREGIANSKPVAVDLSLRNLRRNMILEIAPRKRKSRITMRLNLKFQPDLKNILRIFSKLRKPKPKRSTKNQKKMSKSRNTKKIFSKMRMNRSYTRRRKNRPTRRRSHNKRKRRRTKKKTKNKKHQKVATKHQDLTITTLMMRGI